MLMMVARLAFVRRNGAQDLLPGSREQVVNQNMYTLTPILVCRSHGGQNAHGWCTLTSLAERKAPNNYQLQLDGTPTAAHDILLSIVIDGRGGCSGRFESNEQTITILTSVFFLLPGKHSTGSGLTYRTIMTNTSTGTLPCSSSVA